VTVVEPDGAITISGVPSDLDLVPGAEVRLNSFFAWTPEGGVAPPFLEALERALRVQVDVVVVLDDFAFARLVDYVGGLPIEGEIGLPVEDQVLSGEQVLALQSVFEGDPLGQTRLQGSILEGLIPQVAKLGSTPDLSCQRLDACGPVRGAGGPSAAAQPRACEHPTHPRAGSIAARA